MEIVCEACKAKLNIPDEKLPQGQRVSVLCPRCKNKLVIDTTDAIAEGFASATEGPAASRVPGADMPEPPIEEDSEPPQPDGLPEFDDVEEDSALDSYGEGEKLALVMDNDAHHTGKIKQAIEELGYSDIRAENTQKAVGKMRLQNFDLLILADQFDNFPLERSPILSYLNRLSMSIRRKMFVVLIGDKFRTMDHMLAFTMSANLVANPRDLDKFSNILRRAISDNEKFYKVFLDTLKEAGKA